MPSAVVRCRKVFAEYRCSSCGGTYRLEVLEQPDSTISAAIRATIQKAGWVIADPPAGADACELVCKGCQERFRRDSRMFEVVRRREGF